MKDLLNRHSLKYKLTVSHISMILIPLLLFGAAGLFWRHFVETEYATPGEAGLENILSQNRSLVAALDETIIKNPDHLADEDYLRQLNKKTEHHFLIVLVEKNGNFVYLPKSIQAMGLQAARILEDNEMPPDHHGYQMFRYHSFEFRDGSSGLIYFVTRDKPPGPAEDIVLAIALLIAMLINIWISYRIARNITTPLHMLNEATKNIARGDLDGVIACNSDDEIGELCRSFDKMRLQLKDAQTISQRYENNRKELIANISHDLKTPITSIRGHVQGMMEGVANTPEKAQKYQQIIYNNSLEMELLIDELFLFSKLDLKQLEFEFEPVDIEAYLKDCAEEKGYELEDQGIQLTYAASYPSHAPVIIDRQRLQRVINNIIRNSIQHCDQNKPLCWLEIILLENDFDAIIEIKDNGLGIPQESLPYVFDRLYRADPSRNRQSGSSGLGLSIARQVIEAHGGKIWAESELGVGTSIFFTLPKVESVSRLEESEELY
ncbi:MAG: sensor histidine kinase [Deltaproteobacteria bacterium]